MLQITKSEMIAHLAKDQVRNCCIILEIEGGGSEFYLSSSSADDNFIVYDFGRGPFYDISTDDGNFFDKCVEHISKQNHDSASLSVLNPEFLNSPILRETYQVGDVSCHYDLRLLNAPKDLSAGIFIRKLTKNDQDIAQQVVCEPERGRPPFLFIFEHFVEQDNGIIYAVISEQKIIAFLSCYNVCEGIYDVDYLYVTPKKRGSGYGAEMIKAYAQDILTNGLIPIYNHAVNEQSLNAAIKAGFTVIRSLYSCSLYRLSSTGN